MHGACEAGLRSPVHGQRWLLSLVRSVRAQTPRARDEWCFLDQLPLRPSEYQNVCVYKMGTMRRAMITCLNDPRPALGHLEKKRSQRNSRNNTERRALQQFSSLETTCHDFCRRSQCAGHWLWRGQSNPRQLQSNQPHARCNPCPMGASASTSGSVYLNYVMVSRLPAMGRPRRLLHRRQHRQHRPGLSSVSDMDESMRPGGVVRLLEGSPEAPEQSSDASDTPAAKT